MAKPAKPLRSSGRVPSSDWKHRYIVVSLFLMTVLIFSRALFNNFIDGYDDDLYVAKNSNLAEGISLASLKYILTAQVVANWHPVTMLSHALDVQLFGLNASGHHLVSILLHSANTVLLYLLLRGATGATWRSAIVAALFAVHPLHVQSVAMVAQRKDVLSTLFWFLAFHAYTTRKPNDRFMLAALGWLVLSLLSKPMAVTFPILLLLVDYWPLRRLGKENDSGWLNWAVVRKAIVEKWPIVLVVAIMSIVAFLVQRDAGATAPIDQLQIHYRIHNAIRSYVEYLWLTLWPSGLSAYYPYPQTFELWKTLAFFCLLAGISALAVWNAQKRPYFISGWLWYLVSLVPVIGIVQVGTQAMADRYTYIPLIGIFVAFVWGTHELFMAKPALQRAGIALIVAVLAIFCTRTWIEIGYWQNAETLWTRALAVTKDNSTAHRNLQNLYVESGRLDEAVKHGYAAIEITPTPGHKQHVDPFLNLARSLQSLGREIEAIEVLKEAEQLHPEHPAVYFELASCYMALGKSQDAEDAVRRMPSSPSTIEETLANVYLNSRQFEIAERHYKEAIRIEPGKYTAYLNYARCLELMGKPDEAREMYAKAAELNPEIAARLKERITQP